MSDTQRTRFALISHRGQSSLAPENTYAAFDMALEQGFANIETDCQLSADGVPMVVHDSDLQRVCSGAPGSVATLPAAEMRQLDVGSWFNATFATERIPLLTDFLERYRGRMHLHLVTMACCMAPCMWGSGDALVAPIHLISPAML